MTKKNLSQAGFTLIETLIYIALFSMCMSGVMGATFELIGSAQKSSGATITQEEGNFVLQKIHWALNGVTTNTLPNFAVPYSQSLDVVSNAGTHVVIRRNPGARVIEMSENGGAYTALTSDYASTTSLQFHFISGSGGAPVGIEASTTINGSIFYAKKYTRI